MVNANDANADGISAGLAKLARLLHKITNNPIDLLDHRLGKDFHFGANLHCGNRAAQYRETEGTHVLFGGDNFAEGAIAPPRLDTVKRIANVDNPLTSLNPFVQLLREFKRIEIFGKTLRNRIPKA